MKDKGVKLDSKLWIKPKVKKAQLFKGVLKIIQSLVKADYANLPGDLLDTIDSLKLEEQPGQIGWKLISRSMVEALVNLIIENDSAFEKKEIVVDQLDDQLDKLLENQNTFIDIDFFDKPYKLSFIERAKPVLYDFVRLFGFNENQVENIIARFASYFIFS